MIRATAILAAFAAAFLSIPAAAQKPDEFEFRMVTESKTVTLDRSKAYILVEAPGMIVTSWISLPDDAQRAAWQEQRKEALAKAIADYPRDKQRYESKYAIWVKTGKRGRAPEKPVEPTEESFAWPDLESRRVFTVGPQNRFKSDKEVSLWLLEVPEGKYVFYSFGMGAWTDCACMGSLGFEAKAGKVTAVRVVNSGLDGQGNIIEQFPKGTPSLDMNTRFAMMVEPPSDYALDPRLPRDMIVAADFELFERLPNWFGGTINRVMPFPGLFAYKGSRMVDLRQPEARSIQEELP